MTPNCLPPSTVGPLVKLQVEFIRLVLLLIGELLSTVIRVISPDRFQRECFDARMVGGRPDSGGGVYLVAVSKDLEGYSLVGIGAFT